MIIHLVTATFIFTFYFSLAVTMVINKTMLMRYFGLSKTIMQKAIIFITLKMLMAIVCFLQF